MGGIGGGIYITEPVIYTDNYCLGRWDRLRTDLGAYLTTGHEFLLFLVALLDVEIVFQLLPFARFDGYWALSNLTGIPDLFSRMRPAATDDPARSGKLPALKPWVRAVFGVWTALTVPVMVLLFVWFAPQFLATFSGTRSSARSRPSRAPCTTGRPCPWRWPCCTCS